MYRFKNSGGPGLKGLLLGSLMAGAMGLALSEQSSTYGAKDDAMGSQQSSQTSQSGSATGSSAAQLPPNVTPGWKIRVCSEKTKADQIQFRISQADQGAKGAMKSGSKSGSAKNSGSMSSSTGSMSPDNTGSSQTDLEEQGRHAQSGQGGTDAHTQTLGGSGSQTGETQSGSTDQSGQTAQSGQATQPGMTDQSGAIGQQTASWSRGEPTEIPLPSALRESDRIKVEATPGQKNKMASACLIYNDHVAKKLNFDDREVSTVRKTESGECGC
ncbi:MAG: hypothetical protein JWP91_348 [Fibrobacteres bacterium]|nr:hypothetical protein [Fibrobacterota bacterium]